MTTTEAIAPTKPQRATIFDIDADRAALIDLLEAHEESQTPEDSAALAAWFDEIEGAFEDKVASYIVVIRSQEAISKGLDEEAHRLRERARVHSNRVKRLKDTIMYVFEQSEITKVETKRGTVALQANGGAAPVALLESDPHKLPRKFQRITVEADIEAIREGLTNNDPDAHAIAVLATRGKHVRVR